MKFFNPEKHSIPLNSLEKFMLAHESEHVAYNSQIVVEFNGQLKLQNLRFAIDKAIEEIPLMRSHIEETFFKFKRFYRNQADFQSEHVIEVSENILTQSMIDQFCQTKFDLSKAPAFKFLIGKTTDFKNILIFNVHHTLCDAVGHFHLLEEIFRAMNGMAIRDNAKSTDVFRYRSLWKYMGWKWFFANLYAHLRPSGKQRQYKMATLIDHHDKPERFVTSTTVYFSQEQQETLRNACKKLNISINEYLTFCSFKALDLSLKDRGDFKTPIMTYLPKTLRPLLKIRYSLNNILSTVWIVGKRDEIHNPQFLEKIKHTINSHKMNKAAKFIFGTLSLSILLRPKKLKSLFQNFDQDTQSITSSLLISTGKVPRSFIFPEGWSEINVWARGTMLKSPGVGVIFTGVAGAETLTIEYLKDLTDKSTIDNFKKHLLNTLLQSEERSIEPMKNHIQEDLHSIMQ